MVYFCFDSCFVSWMAGPKISLLSVNCLCIMSPFITIYDTSFSFPCLLLLLQEVRHLFFFFYYFPLPPNPDNKIKPTSPFQKESTIINSFLGVYFNSLFYTCIDFFFVRPSYLSELHLHTNSTNSFYSTGESTSSDLLLFSSPSTPNSYRSLVRLET